ncbi:MAG: iron-containing alcohol dehydrogenase [Candidatus Manganitrophus sp.]|nr:MAG: iron-containing alcohol dehydrogenase [Candidatus Manganitrophus sp.]
MLQQTVEEDGAEGPGKSSLSSIRGSPITIRIFSNRSNTVPSQTASDLVSSPLRLKEAKGSRMILLLSPASMKRFISTGLCRHSYLVAIGGGALLDMAGYAAATAHRGIRLIRVPTTVLGQNDAGVGVKNSINAFGKKNFLGAFSPPFAVLNDRAFLTTLSDRDWRSGISEAIKVALIKSRPLLFFGAP